MKLIFRYLNLFFIAILVFSSISCGTINEPSVVMPINWGVIYQETLESYFIQDTILHENIEYIAIDMESLEYANDTDKENIKLFFEVNYYPVIDADLEKLKENGLYDARIFGLSNGVLIHNISVEEINDMIVIHGWKYRGITGGKCFETKWIKNSNGSWTMNDTTMIAIS